MRVIDEAVRTQIIIAASVLVGPSAAEDAVAAEVRRIVARLEPGSLSVAEFNRVERRNESTDEVKTFRATILHVDKELTSTRGVVFLKTKESQWHPNGKELVRTDRTDNEDGRAMARLAQSLIGHHVTIVLGVERTAGGTSRTLRSIQDHGPAEGFDPAKAEFQPDFTAIKDTSKLASFQPPAP